MLVHVLLVGDIKLKF